MGVGVVVCAQVSQSVLVFQADGERICMVLDRDWVGAMVVDSRERHR